MACFNCDFIGGHHKWANELANGYLVLDLIYSYPLDSRSDCKFVVISRAV